MKLELSGTGPLCEEDANMENGNIEDEIAGSIAERSKQAKAVIEAEEASVPFKEGQDHYLISARWWELWKAYSGVLEEDDRLTCLPDGPKKEAPNPGPITNNELLNVRDDHSTLKNHADEGSGYRVLSQGSWDFLSKLYGGGPAMPRPVLATCGKLRVEARPLTLQVFRWPDYDKAKPLQISRRATVAQLKTAACALFELDEKDVELSDYFNSKIYASLETPEKASKKLEEAQLTGPQHILLGEKSAEGKWPSEEPEKYERETQRSTFSTFEPRFRMTLTPHDDPQEDRGRPRGLSGLGNLGNTCFMNSSLQCLSHAAPLVRMFLSGAYKEDLNRDNPLGNKGELAEAFGSLLKLLWQGNTAFVSPRAFKKTVGHCAPQFSGYQQHDSQELLAFLLDGLHEDLNRVRQKPYIEEADADGRPDAVVAKEVWNNYRKRNDSVIVDHFQGMYKSKLECPKCSHVGVKFDPYMYLSLNLPESKRRTLQVTALYVDGSQPPLQHAVDVPKTGTIGQVYEALARELGLPADQKPMELLLLIELQQHRAPIKFTDPEAPVSAIKERANLMVYRYASQASGPSIGRAIHLFHRRRHYRKRGVSDKEQPLSDLIGAPLVVYLREEEVAGLHLKKQSLDDWASNVRVQQPNVLDEALLAALRPFKKARAEQNGNVNGHAPSSAPVEPHAQSSKAVFSPPLGENLANGEAHTGSGMEPNSSNMEPNSSSVDPVPLPGSPVAPFGRLPGSPLAPFGTLSNWPAFGMGSSPGAPPQSPAASPACSNSSAATDCASIQAQAEFDQPFSDEEDEGGQHSKGPHSKAQRLRGASQQSLTGLADANGDEAAPQSASAQNGVDIEMACPDGWVEPAEIMGDWAGQRPDEDGIEWESAVDTKSIEPGGTVRNGYLELTMHPHVTPEQTPQHSPQRDAPLIEIPLGLSKGISRAEPFDMWAAQNGTAQPPEQSDMTEVPAAEQAAGVQFPWQLKCCSSSGETKLYNMPRKDDDLFFAVEWAPESAAQYDVSALERPLQSESSVAAAQREEERRNSSFTLQQCLESFVQKERLDSAEAWYCPKCKEHVQATKKLDLWSTPEVLILHLKRFQYTTQSRRKIDAPVEFPLTDLDLSPYLLHQQVVPPKYDLFAISQHYGSLGGGHYTATCEFEGQGWYAFNDSGVTRIEAMDPADSARSAYVLFYRRQDDLRSDPSCLPPGQDASAQEDNVMEDADGVQGTSQPGSPRTKTGGPLDEASPGSLIGPAMANGNGNGFFYEHVPAEPESALETAVQDVVVSDASADGAEKDEALEIQSPDIPLSPLLQGVATDIPESPLLGGPPVTALPPPCVVTALPPPCVSPRRWPAFGDP